jgi:glutamine amidotransferase
VIAIIDSGIANLRSVAKGFARAGFEAEVVEDPRSLRAARGIVLPGVGAFADGIAKVRGAGFDEALLREIERGKPLLGICLGLHFLFSESEEFGTHRGLDILRGRVVRFPAGLRNGGEALKIPHMGWNTLAIERPAPILKDVPAEASVYFVHSYYVEPEDRSVVAATTTYGMPFTSVIWRDNILATQFHPEKSQQVGLAVLRNFGALCRST